MKSTAMSLHLVIESKMDLQLISHLSSLVLLCHGYGDGFGIHMCTSIFVHQRRGSNEAPTQEMEDLAQDGCATSARAQHGSGTDALSQSLPGIFHDAQRTEWKALQETRLISSEV